MFVTPTEARSGLLIAVISGGRPTLAMRPTAKFLQSAEAFGANDIVWCVCERDVPLYEPDDYPILSYPEDWAVEYAKEHWTDIQLPEDAVLKGGLAGAGRVYAMQEAERRGCWGVLQLDDNIVSLTLPRGGGAGARIARDHGGLSLYADLLAAATLCTNSRMTGAQLNSAIGLETAVVRAGFPYSLFIERVGEGREDWYGPLEGDIIQAYQYGRRADGATAALVPSLRYMKRGDKVSPTGVKKAQEDRTTDVTGGGFRTIYDSSRSVQLQRMFPQSTKVRVMKKHSNGRGDPRVFHKMIGGPGTPVKVLDEALYGQLKDRLQGLLALWQEEHKVDVADKVARRKARLERMRESK